MADIMTRWLRGYRNTNKSIKRVVHILHQHGVVTSPSDSGFSWSGMKEIRNSQEKHSTHRPK